MDSLLLRVRLIGISCEHIKLIDILFLSLLGKSYAIYHILVPFLIGVQTCTLWCPNFVALRYSCAVMCHILGHYIRFSHHCINHM